jgi:hypothetical protein
MDMELTDAVLTRLSDGGAKMSANFEENTVAMKLCLKVGAIPASDSVSEITKYEKSDANGVPLTDRYVTSVLPSDS